MRSYRWITMAGLLAVIANILGPVPLQGQPAKGEIDLKVVKYAELGQIVASHKGKVVLVDFWGVR